MNIFILDEHPYKAAQMQCDAHVVKMTVESVQILSTVKYLFKEFTRPMYSPTHEKHPCVKWACESKGNYEWLFEHFKGLLSEYKFRYDKNHSSKQLVNFFKEPPKGIPDKGRTPFVCAMDESIHKKYQDPVMAYRMYYMLMKSNIAKWKKGREAPSWWVVGRI